MLLLTFFLSAGVSIAADVKQEWLTSKLYGSDDKDASLGRVTITAEADKYLIHIANDSSFQCELTFDGKGEPERLSNCRSLLKKDNPRRVLESEIPLSCSRLRREVVCKGQYTLASGSYTSKTYMTIARSLGASFDCSKQRQALNRRSAQTLG